MVKNINEIVPVLKIIPKYCAANISKKKKSCSKLTDLENQMEDYSATLLKARLGNSSTIRLSVKL